MALEELREWLLDVHAGTVDEDRLDVIADELAKIRDLPIDAAVVELGCYRGAMSLWMRAVLDEQGDRARAIHVFDSFQGLPEPGENDSTHLSAGELAVRSEEVVGLHEQWSSTPPVIHPGWFHQTLGELPPRIAFGYLDGDFEDSIYTSLAYCVPRLEPGGALIVDDYADLEQNPRAWNGLPGVKVGCDRYVRDRGLSPLQVIVGDGDLAFGRLAPGSMR